MPPSPAELSTYYRKRALSYEAIYHRPDHKRLTEQEDLARALRAFCTDRTVLEIAAGTGWWTVHAAATARHVTATDAVAETLAIAQTKPLPPERVTFCTADAFDLNTLGQRFDAIVCCFFLSHVLHADRTRFLTSLCAALNPGGHVFLADNNLVPGLGGDLVRPPASDDTFKRRTLPDGTKHLVLKNYMSTDDLRALCAPFAAQGQVDIQSATHFWHLHFQAL